MKLHEDHYSTRGSSVIRESAFEIGDDAHIIKLLRDSLYSNPILAICREIASNSRDAHREIGTPDRPIEITLPNAFDDNIHFRDFGPGISPSRMEDVFVKFGNSTKRNDNSETGGFGLGAKTPFAYTATFIIDTTSTISLQEDVDVLNAADEEAHKLSDVSGKHLKCVYMASLGGERESGGVKLLSAELTTEETGTIITVGVREKDYQAFYSSVEQSTRYWKVRPIIKGHTIEYVAPRDEILSGENWTIRSRERWGGRDNFAIVDGVMYPLDLYQVESKIEEGTDQRKFIETLRHTNIYIEFNTGDLSLTPNREQLHYNDHTVTALAACCCEIHKSAGKVLEQKITKADTYSAACNILGEFNNNVFEVKQKFFWKNSLVYPRTHIWSWDHHRDHKRLDRYEFRNGRSDYGNRRWFRKGNCNSFSVKDLVVINDTGKERVPAELLQNLQRWMRKEGQEHAEFILIVPKDGDVSKFSEILKKEVDIDFNDMGVIKLSDFKGEEIARTRSRRGVSTAWKGRKWDPVKIDRTNGEGIYVSLRDRKTVIFSDHTNRTNRRIIDLLMVCKALDIKIDDVYGIRDDVIEKLGSKWVPLEAKIQERVNELNQKYPDHDARRLLAASSHVWFEDGNYSCDVIACARKNFITLPESDDYSALVQEARKAYHEYEEVSAEFAMVYERFLDCESVKDLKEFKNHPLKVLSERLSKKYPLLRFVDDRYFDDRKMQDKKNAIAEYVKMMNEREGEGESQDKKILDIRQAV